jgi:hypothetical protein
MRTWRLNDNYLNLIYHFEKRKMKTFTFTSYKKSPINLIVYHEI